MLGQNETLSALQVLSLAEGLNKTAAPEHSRIMRVVPGSTRRTEIPLNLKKLMYGKETDTPLMANDILLFQTAPVRVWACGLPKQQIQIATGVAIYGRF